jgi:hypothetical protein
VNVEHFERIKVKRCIIRYDARWYLKFWDSGGVWSHDIGVWYVRIKIGITNYGGTNVARRCGILFSGFGVRKIALKLALPNLIFTAIFM